MHILRLFGEVALSTIDKQYGLVTVLSGLLEMLIIKVLNLKRLTCPLVSQRVVKSTTDSRAIVELTVVSEAGSNYACRILSLDNLMELLFQGGGMYDLELGGHR